MKKTFLPIPNTSAHAKNQLSRSNSKGARPWTDKQTNTQTSVLRAATDRRPSKISRLKIELSVLADRQKNKYMFAAIETINQYPDKPRSRFQKKPSSF